MPKIIDNLKREILDTARRQVLFGGYGGMTMRSVAEECGVAVGTIYNYFPSKAILTASFMLEDWMVALGRMKERCGGNEEVEAVLGIIHRELRGYIDEHDNVFRGGFPEGEGTVMHTRHRMLRSQLAELLTPLCEKRGKCGGALLSEFVAEALLAWTVENRGFEDVSSILCELFE